MTQKHSREMAITAIIVVFHGIALPPIVIQDLVEMFAQQIAQPARTTKPSTPTRPPSEVLLDSFGRFKEIVETQGWSNEGRAFETWQVDLVNTTIAAKLEIGDLKRFGDYHVFIPLKGLVPDEVKVEGYPPGSESCRVRLCSGGEFLIESFRPDIQSRHFGDMAWITFSTSEHAELAAILLREMVRAAKELP